MKQTPYNMTEKDKDNFIQSRKKRNFAIGLALMAFIIIIYCVTIFKLGSQLFV